MIHFLLISLFVFISCGVAQQSKIIIRDNIKMLYGKTTAEQLAFDYPAWEKVEKAYVPDPAIEKELKAYKLPTKVLVIFGTWCSDSKRNVPRFLKSVKGNKNIQLEFYAVDRKLKAGNGLAEKYQIKRVPTFVVLQDGKEIGRIVERPVISIEKDLSQILQK